MQSQSERATVRRRVFHAYVKKISLKANALEVEARVAVNDENGDFCISEGAHIGVLGDSK